METSISKSAPSISVGRHYSSKQFTEVLSRCLYTVKAWRRYVHAAVEVECWVQQGSYFKCLHSVEAG